MRLETQHGKSYQMRMAVSLFVNCEINGKKSLQVPHEEGMN